MMPPRHEAAAAVSAASLVDRRSDAANGESCIKRSFLCPVLRLDTFGEFSEGATTEDVRAGVAGDVR